VRAGTGRNRAVKGFVVKIEEVTVDPTTKRKKTTRREVSRLYHSRDAADVCCRMFKANNPQGDYYVHEKAGKDDAEIY
jgi:hypothetical protein